MLAIEDMKFGEEITLYKLDSERLQPYDRETIIYTADKLIEANYIKGGLSMIVDEVHNISLVALTWDGHHFLDNIRDDGVWKKTKNVTSKFSSISIPLLSSVASSVISKMISNELGL
jgi:hypothetical protein